MNIDEYIMSADKQEILRLQRIIWKRMDEINPPEPDSPRALFEKARKNLERQENHLQAMDKHTKNIKSLAEEMLDILNDDT